MSLNNRDSRVTIGEFLNKDEMQELIKLLRGELPIRSFGSERDMTV